MCNLYYLPNKRSPRPLYLCFRPAYDRLNIRRKIKICLETMKNSKTIGMRFNWIPSTVPITRKACCTSNNVDQQEMLSLRDDVGSRVLYEYLS